MVYLLPPKLLESRVVNCESVKKLKVGSRINSIQLNYVKYIFFELSRCGVLRSGTNS